jgi:hypothetical protein
VQTDQQITEGVALLVEKPVFRGRGNAAGRWTAQARFVQACRLRESGWSVQGLATLYDVSFETIEKWFCRMPHGTTIRRPGRTMRTIEEKVEEAVVLIQLGCWPLRQPSDARVLRSRRTMNRSRARKRAQQAGQKATPQDQRESRAPRPSPKTKPQDQAPRPAKKPSPETSGKAEPQDQAPRPAGKPSPETKPQDQRVKPSPETSRKALTSPSFFAPAPRP